MSYHDTGTVFLHKRLNDIRTGENEHICNLLVVELHYQWPVARQAAGTQPGQVISPLRETGDTFAHTKDNLEIFINLMTVFLVCGREHWTPGRRTHRYGENRPAATFVAEAATTAAQTLVIHYKQGLAVFSSKATRKRRNVLNSTPPE